MPYAKYVTPFQGSRHKNFLVLCSEFFVQKKLTSILTCEELQVLRSKFSTKSRTLPKAFTEKGLYMLATILRSKRSIEVTFAIIETFVKVRKMKRELVDLHNETDKNILSDKMNHFSDVLSDIVMPDLETSETESILELNFIIGKIKHTVKRIRKNSNNEP